MFRGELIKLYNNGELHDLALYQPSNADKYVICFYSGTYVFGYYQYLDNKKQFFKATTILRPSFKVKGKSLRASMFTPIEKEFKIVLDAIMIACYDTNIETN